MRHLQRPLPAPICLSNCDHQLHSWSRSRPSSNGRKAIWVKLTQMQKGFCCYCESTANKTNGHIEHFFHKGNDSRGNAPYRNMTFDWNNLFGCCGLNSSNTCGHYKDRKGVSGPGHYEPSHLIKPDIDNPNDFFEFLPTGVINAKPSLNANDSNRARETLRVLNLSALNGARKRQIDIFRIELEALLSLDLEDNIALQEVDRIKQNIKKSEFQTAVLQVLF